MRLGGGVAASAVLAGLGLASYPSDASAIIGIDDALLGAVVLAIASLGGYALYSQYVSNNSLQGLGAGFSSYVSSSSNRVAAATAAAQIAATYGVNTTQARLESAAELIANGQGAFADAMASAASTGRLALDGLVSGSDDLVGAMRELVAGYLSSGALTDVPQAISGLTTVGTGSNVGTLPFNWGIQELGGMCSAFGCSVPSATSTGYYHIVNRWESYSNGARVGTLYAGTGCIISATVNGSSLIVSHSGTYQTMRLNKRNSPLGIVASGSWVSESTATTSVQYTDKYWVATPDVFGGPLLPGVDVPVDVPDVIGASWDSMPIASDLVINPSTGDIVGAGSVPLPSSVPTTADDYAIALQDALAGVIGGAISLPVGIEVPVTVATPLGVATMPISDAISTETSLQLEYVPDIPVQPVEPPTEVPEGPWTPVVELPFNQLWPFNMIYSVIEVFNQLGGS